jgi:hypothetical protein
MATTKASGLRRMTQHPPEAPAFETRERPSRCVRAFGVTADRNHAFGQVIAVVAWVKRLGLFHGEFPGRFAKTCRLSIEDCAPGRSSKSRRTFTDVLTRIGLALCACCGTGKTSSKIRMTRSSFELHAPPA